MNRDLDYFKEFLDDPSAPSLGEFYRMVREWADYLAEHKEDFNYLEDEEWIEIRERFNVEYLKRQEEKDLIDARWEIITTELDRVEELSDKYVLSLMNMQMTLIRDYPDYFNIPDVLVKDVEESAAKFKDSVEKAKISEENLRISEQKVEDSLNALDDKLMEIEERTGIKPKLFTDKLYIPKKGN